MSDYCESKEIMVIVQKNGIIRTKQGKIIGRLVKEYDEIEEVRT